MNLLLDDLLFGWFYHVVVVMLSFLSVVVLLVHGLMLWSLQLFFAGLLAVLMGAVGMLLSDPLLAARTRFAHNTQGHFDEATEFLVHNLHLFEALDLRIE